MWTEDRLLELISLYKEKPIIWNSKNPKYYQKNLRVDAWREIAHSLGKGLDAEECKNKMLSLLASYRRERRKTKNQSGDEKYKSTWFAYEAMTFLGKRVLKNQSKRRNNECATQEQKDDNKTTVSENSLPLNQPTSTSRLFLNNPEIHTVQLRQDDEYAAIGINVEAKLRKMSKEQSIYAENLINQTLFKGILCQLTKDSKIETIDIERPRNPKYKQNDFNHEEQQMNDEMQETLLIVKRTESDISDYEDSILS